MDVDELPRARLPRDEGAPAPSSRSNAQPEYHEAYPDGGERGDEDGERPPPRSRKRSLKAERLRSNLNAFASQLASIRAKVAARSLSGGGDSASDNSLPVFRSVIGGEGAPPANAKAEHLRLPLLRRIDQANQEKQSPRDPFVNANSIARREAEQDKFQGDSTELAFQEQVATSALQEANRLDEQVRVAAVAFTKNERSWPFDERARRYRELLELRTQAEDARVIADKERTNAQRHRSLLRDPYRRMKVMAASPQTQLMPIKDAEYTWLWVLASPLPSLPFTPREETLQDSIQGEKELSTHVVYYIAPSTYADRSVMNSPETPEQNTPRLEDRPPTNGWISCSNHGAFPAPQVTPTKSSIETWVVQGAGAGHVNGRYIKSGAHDLVRKFKSSSGVELFRKRVPVVSTLAQSLYDAPRSPETTSCIESKSDDLENHIDDVHQAVSALPSALRSIEKDEHSFRSMQRVGAWLGMNEETERYRRMKEEAAQQGIKPDNGEASDSEADTRLQTKRSPIKVKIQNKRVDRASSSSNITQARVEGCAPVCKEWVLFLKCTKKEADSIVSETSRPSQKPGLGCPYRHYYISTEEKIGMTIWAQEEEYLLEKGVLSAIIAREAHIKTVKRLCSECMTAYQQNLRKDTEANLAKLLLELNHVRLVSIKVIEKIEAWRSHIRRLGFTRYDPIKDSPRAGTADSATDTSFLLGWSATITVSTGKQLYKGSKAFVSRVKRFCRPEDAIGKKEQHIAYLGYFKTRVEAEKAYDEFASSEARRLNTTTTHLPRRRGVFRSCGKHFAVESERLGPSFCIECKTQALASSSSFSSDDWTPPFYYTPGENYILRMAEDLDFLDGIPPLKSLLNDGRGSGDRDFFPLLGNTFLLPRDPVYDITVLPLTSFGAVESLASNEPPGDEDMLDRDRIARAQKVLLQEVHLHRPDNEQQLDPVRATSSTNRRLFDQVVNAPTAFRVVEALYWDRCAALQIRQQRLPLAFRQANVWCRPDAGEWSSLVARGAHQLHFIFETNLAAAGREMQKKRKELLKAMRKVLATPLYLIHERSIFTDLITAGQTLKGDVVQLEVNNLTKRVARYNSWCVSCGIVQRCFRRYVGRKRASTRLRVLRQACRVRMSFLKSVHDTARLFYEQEVVTTVLRRAARKISSPVFRCVVKKDGERLIVSVHPLTHYRQAWSRGEDRKAALSPYKGLSSMCCPSCARRFRVKATYGCEQQRFSVIHGVCTCSADGSYGVVGEKWLLRVYNPVNNAIYRTEIGNNMLSQLMKHHYELFTGRDEAPLRCRPVSDMEHSQQTAIIASIQASYHESRASRAYHELLSWKRLNNDAIQARKTASVALTDCIDAEEKTQADFGASIISAKKAMNFAGRTFSEAQAWDPLENANDWKLVVHKRRLEKQLLECRQETERCRVSCFQATYDELYTRTLVSQAQKRYDSGWLPTVEYHYRVMEAAATKEAASRATLECSIRRLCAELLSLRDKGVPLRRQLMVYKPISLGRAAVRVAFPEFQRQRSCLQRRVLRLQNHEKADKNFSKRMVVSVFVLSRNSKSEGSRSVPVSAWWACAYDSTNCTSQEVFMEWEIVRLLVRWKLSTERRNDALLSRSTRQKIADELLSIAMLDRFTGEFTLSKLRFYQQMRLAHPQVHASKWFQDLRCGRKSGRGDEILRQGTSICGRLGVMVVFENWGDLAFEFYHAATGRSYELSLPIHEISRRLSRKPILLRLWITSVMSNSYALAVLKHVMSLLAITESEDSTRKHQLGARSEHKSTWRKCYQATRTIQGRRILVSVREDAARDFRVMAFDLASNHTYRLEMEREALARIFKDSAASRSGESLMPLLTRQNRSRLYEWIVDRLQFQNLMEHPATLSASLSPLARGFHVRQSFQLLNRWVSSSERIPVTTVSLDEIDRLAAQSETSAISALLFDQLALIPAANLPFDMNKQRCGTLEWADVGARLREENTPFPFMKLDVCTHSHNLMVRLRREVFAEAELRRQKAAQSELQREEAFSLTVAIGETLESTRQRTRQVASNLEIAQAMVAAVVKQWVDIHAELVHLDGASRIQVQPIETNNALQYNTDGNTVDAKRLATLVDSELLASPHVFDILRSSVKPGIIVSLPLVSTALGSCLHEIGNQIAERLQALVSDFESILKDSPSLVLQRLQHLCHLVISVDNDAFGLVQQTCDTIGSASRLGVELLVDSSSHDGLSNQVLASQIPTDSHDDPAVCTALVIPQDPSLEMQEVFLDTAISSCLVSDNRVSCHMRADLLASAFEPIFREQLGPIRRHGQPAAAELLACCRVPGGLIVSQVMTADDCKDQLQRNPRANAIAEHSDIYGVAVYLSLRLVPGDATDLRSRLILGSDAYTELANTVVSNVLDPNIAANGVPMAPDKKRRVRSTKFLPWKQLANDRMRVARMFKRSLATSGRSVVEPTAESSQRENATIVTTSVSFRHLESLTGRVLVGPSSLETATGVRFVVSDTSLPQAGHAVSWKLDVASPLVLSNMQLGLEDCCGKATSSLGDGTARIDMSALQIELDNVEHPRRIVFSCRDLQSQRRYVVDCGYYDLNCHLRTGARSAPDGIRELHWRRPRTIQEWRSLAQFAARHLAFRKMNGTFGLYFDFAEHLEPDQQRSLTEHASVVDNKVHPTDLPLQERSATSKWMSNHQFKSLKDAVGRCCTQRLAAHQQSILLSVAVEQARITRQLLLTRRHEWVSMILEDQRSQVLRGLLVLDTKTLHRVQTAYKNGTQRARKQRANAKSSNEAGNQTQFLEVCKDLGVPAEAGDGAWHQLEAITSKQMNRKQQQTNRTGSANGSNVSPTQDRPLLLADVAEWWRQHLLQGEVEKPLTQQAKPL